VHKLLLGSHRNHRSTLDPFINNLKHKHTDLGAVGVKKKKLAARRPGYAAKDDSAEGGGAAGEDKAPAYADKAPAYTDKAPAYTDKAPAYTDKAPAYTDKAPAYTDKAPAYTPSASMTPPVSDARQETEAERLARIQEEEEEEAARQMQEAALRLQRELAECDPSIKKSSSASEKAREEERAREAELRRKQQQLKEEEDRRRKLEQERAEEEEKRRRVEEQRREEEARHAKEREREREREHQLQLQAEEERVRLQRAEEEEEEALRQRERAARAHVATAEQPVEQSVQTNIYGMPLSVSESKPPPSIYATGATTDSSSSIYSTASDRGTNVAPSPVAAATSSSSQPSIYAGPSIYTATSSAGSSSSSAHQTAQSNGANKGGVDGLEAMLARVKGDADQRASDLKSEMARVGAAQARVQGERQDIMRSMAQERDEVKRLETAEAAAQEREDFEEAARVVELSEAAAERLREFECRMSELGKQSDALDDTRHELHKQLVKCWGECAREIEYASRGYVGEFEQDLRRAKREIERSQEEIDDQKEQVKHQLEHLRLDKEKITDERSVVQKAVDDKTSVQRAEMGAKEAQRDGIRKEIEELLALLKIKQDEEARLTSDIDKIGRDISDVTSMYGAKLTKLDDRQTRAEAQVHWCVCVCACTHAYKHALHEYTYNHAFHEYIHTYAHTNPAGKRMQHYKPGHRYCRARIAKAQGGACDI
jgi:hypothetical protein